MMRGRFAKGKYIITVALITGIFIACNSKNVKRTAKDDPDTTSLTGQLLLKRKKAILNDPLTKQMQGGLESYYNKMLGGKRFNGAMLIARKGVIIFEKYNGYANIPQHIPIDRHTTFQLASTSKTFTGMAILWLQQQHILNINDTLQQYFPDFPYKGITLKMLLNHRSGLPNYLYCCESLWPDKTKYMTNLDVIRLLTKYRPKAQYPPDRHFNYCNTNYCILAAVIEKITGEKLGDFLAETFFRPLGMKDTWVYTPASGTRPEQSISYDYRGRPEPDNPYDGVVGDKNVYSTPEDLLKWDQALYAGKLFTDSSLTLAYTPYSHEKPGIRNYGLGWRMMAYPDGEKIIYHNGWWHGNNSVFYRFLKDTTTLVILSNKYDRAIYQVHPIWTILHENDGGDDTGED